MDVWCKEIDVEVGRSWCGGRLEAALSSIVQQCVLVARKRGMIHPPILRKRGVCPTQGTNRLVCG